MTELLLAALGQRTLTLDEPPAPRAPQVRGRTVLPRAATARGAELPSSADADELARFARAVAERFGGLEALQVGPDVGPRPGFGYGDVVLVDWAAEVPTRLHVTRANGQVCLAVAEDELDYDRPLDAAASGAVFAVVRRVMSS